MINDTNFSIFGQPSKFVLSNLDVNQFPVKATIINKFMTQLVVRNGDVVTLRRAVGLFHFEVETADGRIGLVNVLSVEIE